METQRYWAILALALVLSAPAAMAAKTIKVAVPNMRVAGADASLGKILTEILTTEASQAKDISVIGSSDIEAMMGYEKEKDLMGCQENISCMAEIGGALGVDQLLVSDLGLVGSTYVINLKLVDTQAVKVIKRIYKTVSGPPDALINMMNSCMPELLAAMRGEEAPAAPAKPIAHHAATPVSPEPKPPATAAETALREARAAMPAPSQTGQPGAQTTATPATKKEPIAEKIASQAAPIKPPEAGTKKPVNKKGLGLPITMVTIGSLAAIGGVVALVLAKNNSASTAYFDASKAEWGEVKGQYLQNLARTESIIGLACTIGGGVVLTSGAILIGVFRKANKAAPAPTPLVISPAYTGQGVGLTLSGSF